MSAKTGTLITLRVTIQTIGHDMTTNNINFRLSPNTQLYKLSKPVVVALTIVAIVAMILLEAWGLMLLLGALNSLFSTIPAISFVTATIAIIILGYIKSVKEAIKRNLAQALDGDE